MKHALIFGPFIGEALYEACYFAPHAIYQKEAHPESDLIVFTRPDRLDLYGCYTDIFVPLTIENDDVAFQKGWSATVYTKQIIDSLIGEVKRKFISRYNFVDHFAPQLHGYKSQLKWQFRRDQMTYSFSPRQGNCKWVANRFDDNFILCDYDEYDFDDMVITIDHIEDLYECSNDKSHTSWLGVMIEVLRKCDLYVGDLKSLYGRLALMLKKPVVSKQELRGDSIHTMKPFRSPVVLCDDHIEGVRFYYENYI